MAEKKLYYQFWPADVPKTIQIPKRSLDKNLQDSAKNYPKATAITYQDLRLSYEKLNEIADRIASYLHSELNVKKGDTVALHFNNIPPCIPAYYGALRSGARVSLLAPLFREMEIEYQLNDCEAKVFILWDGFAGTDDSVIPRTKIEAVIFQPFNIWSHIFNEFLSLKNTFFSICTRYCFFRDFFFLFGHFGIHKFITYTQSIFLKKQKERKYLIFMITFGN